MPFRKSYRSFRTVLLSSALSSALLAFAGPALAGEVGFAEDFALARDRSQALEQLIPGTEDYYFYHALHYQSSGRLDETGKLLKPWIDRHGRTARVVEIENRQALLGYTADPRRTLEFLRERLGLRFDHQREVLGEKPALPESLDSALISREAVAHRALDLHPGTTDGFEDTAIEWALGLKLDPDRRRQLLGRLSLPGLPGLARLIAEDLGHAGSGGFGSLSIHRQLLLDELEECVRIRPSLLGETAFADVYLTKLWPRAGEDWRSDAAAREAYLERLWAFASRLGAAFNSLKVHVLHHRLAHDRALGKLDKGRFLAYLRLPRAEPYARKAYVERDESVRHRADLAADFSARSHLPAVGNDEPLVRSCLAHFFLSEDSYVPYAEYLEDTYLKRVFAETKVLAGQGDAEAWYALLGPASLQELKERVDLDFAFTQRTVFRADEPVGIDVHVKNVKTLIVKVFELNPLNFYRDHQREIDAAIDLDGLVANEEATHEYNEPPLRRVQRHFDLPSLSSRGVYAVELIGGGKQSRALVRKGRLRYLERTSPAGHVFTVLDDSNQKLSGASLWMAGTEYRADAEGEIVVPFSTAPKPQSVILVHEGFASLDSFDHQGEAYRLAAGIHVEREALLAQAKAKVIVRPSLTLNGEPVTLSILEDPKLIVVATDHEGVSTSQEVQGFQLFEDRESVHEFQVPAHLASLRFVLKAGVRSLSQGKRVELEAERSFPLNRIEDRLESAGLHLVRSERGYALELLGKSGEPRAGRPVRVLLKHRDFRDRVEVLLRSDVGGRVHLSALDGIESLSAVGPGSEGAVLNRGILTARSTRPASLHGRAGAVLRVSCQSESGESGKPLRSDVALLEVRGASFVRDWFSALAVKDGFLELRGLPAGDYELVLKREAKRMRVRVEEGTEAEGYVLSGFRQLEARRTARLQIASIAAGEESLRVRLEGASELCRVHVFATRYAPEYPPFADLDAVAFPELRAITSPPAESVYVAGRDIGDEYRYVLERRLARQLPGNMLARPSLLLNPWAVRPTETALAEAQAGEGIGAGAAGAYGKRVGKGSLRDEGGEGETGDTVGVASLEFLPAPAAVLVNLRPDADGVVTVPRQALAGRQWVHVVAVSPEDLAYRQLALPEPALVPRDLRLAGGLDPARHFIERKDVEVAFQDGEVALADVTASELEAYDSLARVYNLFATLSADATLAEFGFVLQWPRLKPEEKREKYSKYASHELNFFLHEKDPEFFAAVVKPYVAAKFEKTFLDRWLLGEDLAPFLKPWAFARLNVVERILLARRIPGEPPRTARHVQDLLELTPRDAQRLERLFKTALRGRALDTKDALGLDRAKQEAAERAKLVEKEAARPAPSEAPPAPAAPHAGGRAPAQDQAKSGEADDKAAAEDANRVVFFKRTETERRKAVRQLYRPLERTQEWAENHYYRLPIERQDASLITANAFWADFARHEGGGPFLSPHVAEASRSFAEMMLALAVLDLPFEAGEHQTETEGRRFKLRPKSPLIAFTTEVRAADPSSETTPILVTQNVYRHGDRYLETGGERRDKFIAGDLLAGVVYGCQVVVTNPTSSPQRLDVLLQVPQGSVPVKSAQRTRSLQVAIEPFHTWSTDYFFYFPRAGTFGHFPVHVSKDEKLVAFAEARTYTVVATPSEVDAASWDFVSQHGTAEQVLEHLERANLGRIRLDRIAWRMRDRDFFEKTVALLERRHGFDATLWSYALFHDVPSVSREYLRHRDDFVAQCGAALESPLLAIDPVERRSYQHLEYWPLVNARAHKLGNSRRILNDRFFEQYQRLMNLLCYRAAPDGDDRLRVAYYLVLQDRIEEAAGFLDGVRQDEVAAKVQRDYLEAYLGFSMENLSRSRARAEAYAEYPVERWRGLFADVLAQLDEIDGKAGAVAERPDRDAAEARLVATEPSLELEVSGDAVTLGHQNLAECRLSYYLIDIELLFSMNPFVGEYSSEFSHVRPNAAEVVRLDAQRGVTVAPVPERFRAANVLIEAAGGGVRRVRTRFASAMSVQVLEPRAQVRVTAAGTGKPLSAAYVKVYAKLDDGSVRFYKDGYTDLRGRFDYGSLSTDEIDHTSRFALLFLAPGRGAVVREAAPPKR